MIPGKRELEWGEHEIRNRSVMDWVVAPQPQKKKEKEKKIVYVEVPNPVTQNVNVSRVTAFEEVIKVK